MRAPRAPRINAMFQEVIPSPDEKNMFGIDGYLTKTLTQRPYLHLQMLYNGTLYRMLLAID